MFSTTFVTWFIFLVWLISCKILARILQVLNQLARFLQVLNSLITRVGVIFITLGVVTTCCDGDLCNMSHKMGASYWIHLVFILATVIFRWCTVGNWQCRNYDMMNGIKIPGWANKIPNPIFSNKKIFHLKFFLCPKLPSQFYVINSI